jgi:hypothetical protein
MTAMEKTFSLTELFAVAGQLFADQFQQSLFAAAVDIAVYFFRTQQVAD